MRWTIQRSAIARGDCSDTMPRCSTSLVLDTFRVRPVVQATAVMVVQLYSYPPAPPHGAVVPFVHVPFPEAYNSQYCLFARLS